MKLKNIRYLSSKEWCLQIIGLLHSCINVCCIKLLKKKNHPSFAERILYKIIIITNVGLDTLFVTYCLNVVKLNFTFLEWNFNEISSLFNKKSNYVIFNCVYTIISMILYLYILKYNTEPIDYLFFWFLSLFNCEYLFLTCYSREIPFIK